MTTNTTDDVDPAPKAEPPIEAVFKLHRGSAPPLKISTLPGVAVPLAARAPLDLELRIIARRAEIIASLAESRDDPRLEAAEARDRLTARLSEVEHIIKEGVVDGWAHLGDAAKNRLEHWLAS
jgi:hypothetical protein